jgi:chemotaxis family two-component system sensor kinase Cph1
VSKILAAPLQEAPSASAQFIQPHGLLLVLTEPALLIDRISANSMAFFGQAPPSLLGTPILQWLVERDRISVAHQLLNCNSCDLLPVTFKLHRDLGGQRIVAMVHRHLGRLIMEVEHACAQGSRGMALPHITRFARHAVVNLRQARSLHELFDSTVRQMRRLTQFERVVLCRVDSAHNCEVLAEDRAERLDTLAGLQLAAEPFFAEEREQFCKSRLSYVPDSRFKPVPLLCCTANDVTPLDLTHATLRTPSAARCKALAAMRAQAALSLSIIKDSKLWGFVLCLQESCHKELSHETRLACELLGEVVASLIAANEQLEDSDYQLVLKATQASLLQCMGRETNFVRGLVDYQPNLLDVARAAGAAIFMNGEYTVVGAAPDPAAIAKLIEWLAHRGDEPLMVTDCLPSLYPPAQAYASCACGLMAASMSKRQNNYVLWFRPEVAQPQTLGPWHQVVQSKSLPWKPVEVAAAQDLRLSMIDLIMQKTEELAKLNLELERSNVELDSFAYAASHDLKEPLRGIHNYTGLVVKELGEQHLIGQSGARLRTVLKLTVRMEELIDSLLHYAQVGRMELSLRNTSTEALVNDCKEMLMPRLEETATTLQVVSQLPTVCCDAVRLAEVFTNLFTNALKYNDKPIRRIEVGSLTDAKGTVTFFVRDNGIGIREKNLTVIFRIFKRLHKRDKMGGGSGTGLTITQRIIERHGGRIWVESTLGVGTTFFFTLGDPKAAHD